MADIHDGCPMPYAPTEPPPLGRALNRAWNEGAERARKSLQAGAEVGS